MVYLKIVPTIIVPELVRRWIRRVMVLVYMINEVSYAIRKLLADISHIDIVLTPRLRLLSLVNVQFPGDLSRFTHPSVLRRKNCQLYTTIFRETNSAPKDPKRTPLK
jgi:hypothetical protein